MNQALRTTAASAAGTDRALQQQMLAAVDQAVGVDDVEHGLERAHAQEGIGNFFQQAVDGPAVEFDFRAVAPCGAGQHVVAQGLHDRVEGLGVRPGPVQDGAVLHCLQFRRRHVAVDDHRQGQ
jgi:hypothetical protein